MRDLDFKAVTSLGTCSLRGETVWQGVLYFLYIKQVTMSLFSGLARFLSKQENGKRAARGDDIPGHGECPRTRDVHLLFFKAIDAVRLVSSLERSRGQQGNKNKWSVTEEGRGEGGSGVVRCGQSFSFAKWKSSPDLSHDSVNILNTAEQYTEKWLT